jgi:hypothetical protein
MDNHPLTLPKHERKKEKEMHFFPFLWPQQELSLSNPFLSFNSKFIQEIILLHPRRTHTQYKAPYVMCISFMID